MTATSLHRTTPSGTDSPRTAVLALTSELDITQADSLRRYLEGIIDRGCDVVVDCSRLRLIDCACFDVLIRAAQAAIVLQLTVALAGPTPLVRATLEATGADTVLQTFPNREAAVLACGRHPSVAL